MFVNSASRSSAYRLIAKRAQLASLMLLGCASLAMAADKAAELSDDFLEYLGSLEGDDDSWIDFAAATAASRESAAKPAAVTNDTKVAARSSSSAASIAAPPPENPVTRHPSSMNTSATSKTGKADK